MDEAVLATLRGETLAVELRCGVPPQDWTTREVDLEEARVTVALDRA